MKKRMFLGMSKAMLVLVVAFGSYGVGAAFSSNIMAISATPGIEVVESGGESVRARRGVHAPAQLGGVVYTETLASALRSTSLLAGMPAADF